MCGIIGILGSKPVVPLLIDGLRRLEYRGYDSAGIAALSNGGIERSRAKGKIANLESVLAQNPVKGTVGIGHTRWATHGVPSERNAHPHSNGRLALVHNGIIENYNELKDDLKSKGYTFESDTDSEVIIHLVTSYLDQQYSPQDAFSKTLARLHGAFSIAVIFAGHDEVMLVARRGSPLAIGYGEGEMYISSDPLALAPLTNQITYLEEGDWAHIAFSGIQIYDHSNAPVERKITRTAFSGAMIGKGEYRHFMEKEIFEQPVVIGDTLQTYVNTATRHVALPEMPFDAKSLPRLTISACGTAYLAGLVAKYWFESIARLPVEVDIASEFRYREAPMPEGGAALFISQSGETLDTLEALRYAKSQNQAVLSLVNREESIIGRESHQVLMTLAGPEIGVASTKAFTTQLTVLAALVIDFALKRGTLTADVERELISALLEAPEQTSKCLELNESLFEVSKSLAEARDVLYLGRGALYPIALEGALKLKELSYIHAEGYPAGELKHGPIALVDDQVPIIVCAPSGPLFDKIASNVQQVIARGGKVILLSDQKGHAKLKDAMFHRVTLPEVHSFIAPIVYSIPVQLLAYHTAVIKGTDVDQPRNLAKSVTVE